MPRYITGSMLRDLVTCERRVHHDLFGPSAERDPVSPFVEMLWSEGSAHEERVLASLPDSGVADLREVEAGSRSLATLKAMASGAQYILGGELRVGDLLGRPDVLQRSDGGWVAGDVKSGAAEDRAGRPRTEYLAQVGLYANVVRKMGLGDGRVAFVLGPGGERSNYLLEVDSAAGVTVEKYIGRARAIRDGSHVASAALCSGCGLCHWRTKCLAELEAADDLTLIAGLGRSLRDALSPYAATVRELAEVDLATLVAANGRCIVPRLGLDRLERFQARARLLTFPGAKPYALRPLPLTPAMRELHFDIEADPTRGGLVYLHGILERMRGEDGLTERFVHFFAEDEASERQAFAEAFRFLAADPDARIYYYSKYERTSYRVLQSRYPDVCSVEDLENLFERPRAIDLLFDVVMPSTEWPTRNVGIKTLAKHLGFRWRDSDPSGAASIAWFADYCRTRDPAIRKRILDYNEDDCRACAVLLDGLLALPIGPQRQVDCRAPA